MQIVIDITKSKWEVIQNGMYCGLLDAEMYQAIKNGIPLPEGHGRLIDYDEMKKIAFEYGRYTETALSYIKPRVLIEADTECEG